MNGENAQHFTSVILLILRISWIPSAQNGTGSKSTPKLSRAQKIALAMSAGPANISKNATIADMTEMSAEPPKELHAGTNGWVCYAAVKQPACLDKEWQEWAAAWMSKSHLKIEGTGIAYMLKGDNGASNTDPYATAPTRVINGSCRWLF